jgi:hypothetical protein
MAPLGLANRRLQPLGHSSIRADMPEAGARRKRQIRIAQGHLTATPHGYALEGSLVHAGEPDRHAWALAAFGFAVSFNLPPSGKPASWTG